MMLHVKEFKWLCSVDDGADNIYGHLFNWDAPEKMTHFGGFVPVADAGDGELN